VPGTTIAVDQVYVRDRLSRTTVLASTNADGLPGAFPASWPSISGDGRYVTFETSSSLAPGDNNLGEIDVYLRDTVAGTTTLVSRTPGGTAPVRGGVAAAISRNGRYVVFESPSTDLDPRAAPAEMSVYRYDVQTGVVQPVSHDVAAGDPSAGALLPQVSDDGNVIAFLSYRAVTAGPVFNVYVKDMTTGVTTVATPNPAGQPLDSGMDLTFELSADGRRVAFVSSTPATAHDTHSTANVYLRDLSAGTTTLVSAGPDGNPSALGGAESTLSSFGGRSLTADNRFVLFESYADLTGGEGDGDFQSGPRLDVFVRDLLTGTTRLLSPNATQPLQDATRATISPDGRFAAYAVGPEPELAPTETGIVLVEVATAARLAVVTRGPGGSVLDIGETLNQGSVFSRSGNLLVFTGGPGPASDLVPGVTDLRSDADVFAFPLAGGQGLDLQPPTVVVPAMATLAAPAPFYDFGVTYADDVAMDPATVGNGDLVVTGPNGFRQAATLVSAAPIATGTQVNATYRVAAPGGAFDAAGNGAYAIEVAAGEVKDASGNALPAGAITGATFTVNVPLPDAPDLQASLAGAAPPSVVGGAKQKMKPLLLTVTNSGNQPASGAVTLRLVASADAVADASDAVVLELPNKKVKLAPGRSKVFRVKPAAFPSVADGDYYLLAIVDAAGAMTERLESNNAALLATPVRIAAPFSDIAVTSPALSGRLAPGKKAALLLTARNDGNQLAKGLQSARVRLTTDPANPAAPSRTLDVPLKLNLKPGATRKLRARLALPADLPAGTYYLVVELLPGAPWSDPDPTDNTATGTATYVI
jgi:Tol biopolymer transport system component